MPFPTSNDFWSLIDRIVAMLIEIDNAIATAGLGVAWLRRKDKETGRTPLDLMRAGAMDEVQPLVMAAMLRVSVRKLRRTRK